MSAEDHQRLKQKWFVIRYEHGLSTTDILFWVFLVVLIASVILLQLQRVSAKKLRQSEAYFRTITQTSPDTIALVRSSDGVVLDVNDVGLETFGFSREEIPQAASTVQLNLWQDLKQRERFLGQLNENGKVDNFEASFLTRAGRQFAGLVSARVIEYQGDPCHLAFIKDVSEIKAASLALQTSEAKYRKLSQEFEAVLDGIVDSLVLLDTELKAVWGNRGAALQFGLSPAEIIGKTCHQLWTCGDTALCDDCVRRVFLSGEPFESIRSTTDARTWGVKGYPVFDRTGKVTNVIQIASDLTEKIQLREEATRASHLAALGSLSAGIAHEINNPTGLVLISLPFVRDAMLDLLPVMDNYVKDYPSLKVAGLPYATFRGEIMQTLEDMQNGAQRVKRIVEDLKDFSCEKSRGDDELVDLEDVVAKSLRLLQNIIKSKTDRFVCNLAKDLPKVRGSAQRLEQVLVNLVQNACLALTSREESVVLTVSADNARQKVVLEVKDEGCGISEDLISKITDPFFTTRREEGGTGLGLSVSARIIEEHGGTLNIISEPDKGSVFTMTLPIADGDEE